jgi:hypothetical protein
MSKPPPWLSGRGARQEETLKSNSRAVHLGRVSCSRVRSTVFKIRCEFAGPLLGRVDFSSRSIGPVLFKTPSHGENRGSSPLGSASKINDLAPTKILVSSLCPVRDWSDWSLLGERNQALITRLNRAPDFDLGANPFRRTKILY